MLSKREHPSLAGSCLSEIEEGGATLLPVTTFTTPITVGGGGGEEGASTVVAWELGVEQGPGLRQAFIRQGQGN